MRLRRLLTALAVSLLMAGAGVAVTATASYACDYSGTNTPGGISLGGECGTSTTTPGTTTPGSGGYTPPPVPQPVYQHYWTPACPANGPPGAGSNDVMCGAAVNVCDARGRPNAIFMRHYRRDINKRASDWELVGTECRGPNQPTHEEPKVDQGMVLGAAYAAAPHPTAHVQPYDRSFVHIPNNYWADADPITKTVTVIGHPVDIVFTIDDISWSFGDGATAKGKGVKDADVGDPKAIEHGYDQAGAYEIVVHTRVGAHFTLPDGTRMDMPGVFAFDSIPVVLPVGEIQTRVDSTR
jgi:hypothetical protein